MFCPKCGTKTPDTAKFCPSCGNPMRSAADPYVDEAQPVKFDEGFGAATSSAQPSPSAASSDTSVSQTSAVSATGAPADPYAGLKASLGLSPDGSGAVASAPTKQRLIICAVAALALIFSLMSWFEIDPNTASASGYAAQGANFLSQLAGQDNDYSSSLGFKASYSVWNLGEAGKIAANYQSVYDSVTGSSSSASSSIDATSAVVTGAWAIGLCAVLAGMALMFSKGRNMVLYIGCVLLVLSWVAFEGLYSSTMHNIGSPTVFPVFMALCAAATFVLSFLMRNPEDTAA